jgi:type II secretory pathway component PulF
MFLSPRMRLKSLAALCHRLAISTSAGIDDRKTWQQERERGGAVQRAVVGQVSDALAHGQSVADALRQTGEYFPPMFRQMVSVGDASGQLDRTYRRLGEHYDHVLAARRAFWGAMAWPAFQFGMTLLVVGVLIYVLGVIQPAGGTDPAFDPLGWGLLGGRGLVIYVNLLIAAAIAVLLIIESARRGARWARAVARSAIRLPVVGSAIQTIALSRFTWALQLVLDTPMDLRKALPLALDATANTYYSQHGPGVARAISSGMTLYAALASTGVFPRELLDAISVGEQAGSLVETVRRQAEDYQQRARGALSLLAQMAGYVLWLLVAALIIVLIFRLFNSYVGTINSLSQPNALK